jgi:hypothetical protein
MNAVEWTRDPVFQLNLLVWMAREQPPTGFVVKPLFFEQEFEILYIEKPFPFPQEIHDSIRNKDISAKPEPELILRRTRDQKALYFEAKADSFSSSSPKNAKQARAHLLAAGPVFAEVMKPLASCLLCYVTPAEKCDLMRVCLEELTSGLKAGGWPMGNSSCHGLAVVNQELHYSWDKSFQTFCEISDFSTVVMSGLSDDTDPSPLMLIYSDEDSPATEDCDRIRRYMVNQAHALLLSDLHRLPPGDVYERTAEKFLLEMTDGVYEYLGKARQKGMRRLVKKNFFRRIGDYSKDRFPGIKVQGQTLQVSFADSKGREEFLDWLEDFKRTAFSAKKPPEEELPLFDGFEDNDFSQEET